MIRITVKKINAVCYCKFIDDCSIRILDAFVEANIEYEQAGEILRWAKKAIKERVRHSPIPSPAARKDAIDSSNPFYLPPSRQG